MEGSSLNANIAEEYITNKLSSIACLNDVMKTILSKANKSNNIDTLTIRNCIKTIQKELTTLVDKKKENLELKHENKINITTINERLSFLESKETELTKKINSYSRN